MTKSSTLVFALVLAFFPSVVSAGGPARRPNLLLIVADDMGYSDLGCFGGEISTPQIDALAGRGLRASNFYAAASCSPSRSMLLSGTDSHIAGIGNMAEWTGPTQRDKPGYEGYLNFRVASIATLLHDGGYHTYMAGKWHLGEKPDQWPAARGFERDLSLLQGAGSHWSDMQGLLPTEPRVTYTRNGQKVAELPKDFYSSKNLTDFILESIDQNARDGRPFFAYLAYQAPHGPLAVPDDWRDRYKGRYDKGYDYFRAERLARQKRLGLVAQGVVGFPRLPNIPAWDTLTDEQRQHAARKMELYAAMIEYMDSQIGRLIDHLKKTGQYDNTVIVFMSDNGAAGEDMAELVDKLAPAAHDWFLSTFDNRPENWGRPGSCVEYGPAWAQVSSVPLRQFKGVVADGGIRVPLIVSGPGVKHGGDITPSLLHGMDLAATFLDLAGIQHPAKLAGSKVAPMQGKSMVPLLTDKQKQIRSAGDAIGWELFGNRALRQGDWKILWMSPLAGGTGGWQLFNLKDDPSELRDRSAEHPDRRQTLLKLWDDYVQRNGVILTDDGPFAPRKP